MKTKKWIAKHDLYWRDGIRIEYRIYDCAFTIWAVRDKIGVRLSRGGLKKTGFPTCEEAFAIGINRLQKWNPFVDSTNLMK